MISPNYESPFERNGYVRKKNDPIPMEYRYWLVIANKRPIALVRCREETQKLVYGRDVALNYFESGKPISDLRGIKILWIASDPFHPNIQICINGLKKRQERKPAVNLPEASRDDVRKDRANGFSIKQLAHRYEVSESTIKRILKNKAS